VGAGLARDEASDHPASALKVDILGQLTSQPWLSNAHPAAGFLTYSPPDDEMQLTIKF
jgi:hypothetical protein